MKMSKITGRQFHGPGSSEFAVTENLAFELKRGQHGRQHIGSLICGDELHLFATLSVTPQCPGPIMLWRLRYPASHPQPSGLLFQSPACEANDIRTIG